MKLSDVDEKRANETDLQAIKQMMNYRSIKCPNNLICQALNGMASENHANCRRT